LLSTTSINTQKFNANARRDALAAAIARCLQTFGTNLDVPEVALSKRHRLTDFVKHPFVKARWALVKWPLHRFTRETIWSALKHCWT